MARGVEVLLLTQSTRRCGGCGFAFASTSSPKEPGKKEKKLFCDSYIELFLLYTKITCWYFHIYVHIGTGTISS